LRWICHLNIRNVAPGRQTPNASVNLAPGEDALRVSRFQVLRIRFTAEHRRVTETDALVLFPVTMPEAADPSTRVFLNPSFKVALLSCMGFLRWM
jgi:hypothetical protein